MALVAFALLAAMLAVYAVLDGYDLGVGTVLHVYGKTRGDRATALASIGPYWNGNEVWLVAAGASLFAFFPTAYAIAFSGFYLPLMVALWLLMGRGIALELRNHLPSALWRDFWDAVFALSSTLLTLVLGVALGNLVRGLPLDPDGFFAGSFAELLNPYALAVGAFALVVLSHHGLAYLGIHAPRDRARQQMLQRRLWWFVLATYVAVSAATLVVHPLAAGARLGAGAVFVVSLVVLAATRLFGEHGWHGRAFLASAAFIVLLLASAAGTIYPYLIPSDSAAPGVSIFDVAQPTATLRLLVVVVGAGLLVAAGSTLAVVRRLR